MVLAGRIADESIAVDDAGDCARAFLGQGGGAYDEQEEG
jgi:hypothetical protein